MKFINKILHNHFYQKSWLCNHAATSNRRSYSAWYSSTRKNTSAQLDADLERLFIDRRVQTLLRKLTGLNLAKVYKWRLSSATNRRHYALMTENMLKEFKLKLSERAQHFLQPVPFKEPRPNTPETLSMDPEISGNDTYNMVFVDLSSDCTDKDRTVVVREPNGRLRTALPEEQYRMNRLFYETPNRPVKEPAIFKLEAKNGKLMPGKALKNSLSREDHENVLDWAAHFYEPDDPKFVELSKCIFDETIKANKLELLHSTRHFSTLAFYMLLNGHIVELLNFYARKESISDVADAIRLNHMMFPDWKTAHSSNDSDLDVITAYLRTLETSAEEDHPNQEGVNRQQNYQEELRPLINLLQKRGDKKLEATAA